MKSFTSFLIEKKQVSLVKAVEDYIVDKLKVRITSAKKDHIRFAIRGGEDKVKAAFSKIGISVAPSDLSLSGTFKTYILKATKNLGDVVKRGDTVLFVNNVRITKGGAEKIFNTKGLSPAEIKGIMGVDIGARDLKKKVQAYWNKQSRFDLSKAQKEYMTYLLDAVVSVPANGSIQVTPPPFQKEDVAEISKDYGEVLAGMWACTGYPEGNGSVNFPDDKAFKIADLLIPNISGGVDLCSVKTKSGSPTSFNGVWGLAKDSGFLSKKEYLKKLTKLEREMIDIIEIVLREKTWSHAIELAKWFSAVWKTDDGRNFGLDELKKITGIPIKSMTGDSIEKWCNNTFGDDAESAQEALQPFYAAIGKAPSQWEKWKTQKYKAEKILSPLAYHMTDWLNNLYEEPLTSLLNTFSNIVQINVDLDAKGNLSVKMSKWNEMQFKFANAGNSHNSRNKIGFKKL